MRSSVFYSGLRRSASSAVRDLDSGLGIAGEEEDVGG